MTTAPASIDSILLCFCTVPYAASAAAIAAALVGERLAASVHQLPGVLSTCRWQGADTTHREIQWLIKTASARFDAMKARLLALHPHEVPELVAVPASHGHDAYLDWVRGAVASEMPEDT